MLKSTFLILSSFLILVSLQAQVFTSSNLPIVLITTDINPTTGEPKPIVDDPRVLGNLKIIFRPDGTRNFLSDSDTEDFFNYSGRISIEARGSSSQFVPKKSYGFTTLMPDNIYNNNVSLLGMPEEHDWILHSMNLDTAKVRDYLSYNLARQMGNYASRTAYCEVLLNGEYIGLYMLLEKVKRDKNRVNIESITTADNTGMALTGGYITKCDKLTGDTGYAWEMPTYVQDYPVGFLHHYPSPFDITIAQNNYIRNVFTLLAGKANANNNSIITGYPTVIDVPSFIDFMLLTELASNPDGYHYSTFFHQDRNGKLRAGPIWDFDLTFGNDLLFWGFDRSKVDVWQFSDGGNDGAKFWKDLFNSTEYRCHLSKRWHELKMPGKSFHYPTLSATLDATIDSIGEALQRENQKWENIPDHALEISKLKSFMSARINWISNHIGGFTTCANVAVPPLVITKINYHPATDINFPNEDDLEFVEITNLGNQTVDLTGIYFRELGFTYSFPAGATLAANERLFLAANPTAFQAKYNEVAFGQFTRSLSNKSQKLLLVDAYGNVIDEVQYKDEAPWPEAADGDGSFLALIDATLDNALASSWVSGASLLQVAENDIDSRTIVYPNPTANHTMYVSNDRYDLHSCEVYNLQGQLLSREIGKKQPLQINTISLNGGMFILKINFDNGASVYRQLLKLE